VGHHRRPGRPRRRAPIPAAGRGNLRRPLGERRAGRGSVKAASRIIAASSGSWANGLSRPRAALTLSVATSGWFRVSGSFWRSIGRVGFNLAISGVSPVFTSSWVRRDAGYDDATGGCVSGIRPAFRKFVRIAAIATVTANVLAGTQRTGSTGWHPASSGHARDTL